LNPQNILVLAPTIHELFKCDTEVEDAENEDGNDENKGSAQ